MCLCFPLTLLTIACSFVQSQVLCVLVYVVCACVCPQIVRSGGWSGFAQCCTIPMTRDFDTRPDAQPHWQLVVNPILGLPGEYRVLTGKSREYSVRVNMDAGKTMVAGSAWRWLHHLVAFSLAICEAKRGICFLPL